MMQKGYENIYQVEMISIEDLVPQDHLLRQISSAVDFSKIYEFVEELYCDDNGRPSIDPVVLFKMVLIQHLYGLPSLRRTADEVSLNIAYRWFLGYSLTEETPHICKKIFDDGRVLSTVYKRPMTKKGNHEWWKYVYDEYYDCIICPEYQVLDYRTTNRDGCREYKSNPEICKNCPTRHLCTESKDCIKTVTKHIWSDYIDLAEDIRYTPKYADLYKLRKEKIERVFADAKEKHAMTYTPYTGLAQVTNWVRLKFATMNLKKLAKWKRKRNNTPAKLLVFIVNYETSLDMA
ncbi:MAG: transposase [Clostridia bacterium]|nr:transposase [Clostridia bacterium]